MFGGNAFRRILQSLSDEKSGGSVLLDNLQKLIGLCAIVLGGLWVLKEFYAFQDRNEAWILKLQALSAKQTELLNTQLENSLKQSETIRQQQELALEVAKLDIQGKQLANELSRRSIESSNDPRYEFTLDTNVKSVTKYPDGTSLFYITMSVDIKNTSDKTLTIDGCLFNIFLGHGTDVGLGAQHALLQNGVPSALDDPTNGPIKWELIRSIPAVWATSPSGPGYGDTFIHNSKFPFKDSDVRTGECAGDINPGDTLTNSNALFLRTAATDFIGHSVDIDFPTLGFWRWKSDDVMLAVAVSDSTPDKSDSASDKKGGP